MIDAAQFFDTEDATALAGGRQTETVVCAWQPIILDIGDDLDPIPPRGWLLGTAFCTNSSRRSWPPARPGKRRSGSCRCSRSPPAAR